MSGSRLLQALVLAAALGAACLLPAATADTSTADKPSQLPDAVLFQLLYEEPNNFLECLGNITDTEGALTRTFLSPAHRRAAGKLRKWMASAGMRTWADQMANVHGVVKGADPNAPAIFIGSHYDTVVDGGKYDGALGIIAGVAAVKALLLEAAVSNGVVTLEEVERGVAAAKASGQGLDLAELLYDQGQASGLIATPVRVIGFADEEGVRFHSTYLGSRALVGTLADVGVLRNIDSAGITVAEALEQAGFDPSGPSLRKMAIPHNKIKAYVEVHMEQGPRLQAAGRALGPVSAIAGQSRLQAEIIGEQGHAGTVPMSLRKDPMAAAAEIMSGLERSCNGGNSADTQNPEMVSDESLVCTVGSMSIWPNAGNVIPGNLNFTLDIRSRWDANRKQVIAQLEANMQTVCARRGLTCRLYVKNEAAAVQSDEEVVQSLMDASVEAEPLVQRLFSQRAPLNPDPYQKLQPAQTCAAGADGCAASSAPPADGKPPVLVSGAGHDAMVFAEVTKMGMLFVRCRDGISHSPLEYVSPDDVAAATATLYQYLRKQLLTKGPELKL